MEARDRRIPEWFHKIKSGELRLPRFQRFEAWDSGRVADLLETVVDELPAGAALILEVGDREPFVSRPMSGAPDTVQRAREHLLDGQQRLTALWRALNDDYEDYTYFVSIDTALVPDSDVDCIIAERRFIRREKRYPMWADSPTETLAKGYAPIRLLHPDRSGEMSTWCLEATKSDSTTAYGLLQKLNQLSKRIADFNIPFLSLPVGTRPSVALSVFIKMNTSYVRLSAYDIVVAQVEEKTGQPLHDLVAKLNTLVPRLQEYGAPEDFALAAAALVQDKSPSQSGFFELDPAQVVKDWDKIGKGLALAVDILEGEKIFDGARLPTAAVVGVLAASVDLVPETLDAHASAKAKLLQYMWRAFFTQRYESAASTRALADLRALRALLSDKGVEKPESIFDTAAYPLPAVDTLVRARWPQRRDILGRAVLAIALRAGGYDFADGEPASPTQVKKREYHHLFADSLLRGAGVSDADRFRALNCALVTWKTNREFSADDPLTYLTERVRLAKKGETEIRRRLESHMIPFDPLNVGGYSQIVDAGGRASQIRSDYEKFLRSRAELIATQASELCGIDR